MYNTILLGAAALLKNVESSIQGTIRLVFQPAEEGGAGGKRMVEEGVVSLSPPAQHAFEMHVWPTLPTGSIASRPGPLLAAAETFQITIAGKGGHAAMPHLTRDPLVTASSLIMNLETIVSRTVSPLASGVVSVTAINAGDAFNVIPASYPSLIMCLLFFFRHHGRFYPFVAGQVVYVYGIFKTNTKFKCFAQHKYHNMIGNGCELLCKADAFVEADACIEITINEDGDAFGATFKLIQNNGNMEDVVDFHIC